MARYGSERIRGHGIPEALESILINGSRVEPQPRDSEADFVGHLRSAAADRSAPKARSS